MLEKQAILDAAKEAFIRLKEDSPHIHVMTNQDGLNLICKTIYTTLSLQEDGEGKEGAWPDILNDDYFNPNFTGFVSSSEEFPYLWLYHDAGAEKTSDNLLRELDYFNFLIKKDIPKNSSSMELFSETFRKIKEKYLKLKSGHIEDSLSFAELFGLTNKLLETIMSYIPVGRVFLLTLFTLYKRRKERKEFHKQKINAIKKAEIKTRLESISIRFSETISTQKTCYIVVRLEDNISEVDSQTKSLIQLIEQKYVVQLLSFNNTYCSSAEHNISTFKSFTHMDYFLSLNADGRANLALLNVFQRVSAYEEFLINNKALSKGHILPNLSSADVKLLQLTSAFDTLMDLKGILRQLLDQGEVPDLPLLERMGYLRRVNFRIRNEQVSYFKNERNIEFDKHKADLRPLEKGDINWHPCVSQFYAEFVNRYGANSDAEDELVSAITNSATIDKIPTRALAHYINLFANKIVTSISGGSFGEVCDRFVIAINQSNLSSSHQIRRTVIDKVDNFCNKNIERALVFSEDYLTFCKRIVDARSFASAIINSRMSDNARKKRPRQHSSEYDRKTLGNYLSFRLAKNENLFFESAAIDQSNLKSSINQPKTHALFDTYNLIYFCIRKYRENLILTPADVPPPSETHSAQSGYLFLKLSLCIHQKDYELLRTLVESLSLTKLRRIRFSNYVTYINFENCVLKPLMRDNYVPYELALQLIELFSNIYTRNLYNAIGLYTNIFNHLFVKKKFLYKQNINGVEAESDLSPTTLFGYINSLSSILLDVLDRLLDFSEDNLLRSRFLSNQSSIYIKGPRGPFISKLLLLPSVLGDTYRQKYSFRLFFTQIQIAHMLEYFLTVSGNESSKDVIPYICRFAEMNPKNNITRNNRYALEEMGRVLSLTSSLYCLKGEDPVDELQELEIQIAEINKSLFSIIRKYSEPDLVSIETALGHYTKLISENTQLVSKIFRAKTSKNIFPIFSVLSALFRSLEKYPEKNNLDRHRMLFEVEANVKKLVEIYLSEDLPEEQLSHVLNQLKLNTIVYGKQFAEFESQPNMTESVLN